MVALNDKPKHVTCEEQAVGLSAFSSRNKRARARDFHIQRATLKTGLPGYKRATYIATCVQAFQSIVKEDI